LRCIIAEPLIAPAALSEADEYALTFTFPLPFCFALPWVIFLATLSDDLRRC
jgi:hypothetical protein